MGPKLLRDEAWDKWPRKDSKLVDRLMSQYLQIPADRFQEDESQKKFLNVI
jgi:hypothetical protein